LGLGCAIRMGAARAKARAPLSIVRFIETPLI
jgi:hypothetical protein